MSTVTLGNSYRFKDYNNNKYLNILVSGNPSNNSNVTIYSLDSTDMAQVWQCVQYSALGVSGALMKSVKDPTFALDNYRGSSNPNNADVYKIGTTAADLKDQLVEFILLTNGYYRIKLAYYDLYLTVTTESTYGGFNVRWQALTGNTNQLWAAELYGSSTITTTAPSSIVDQTFYVKNFNTGYNLNVYGTDTVANERNVNVYSKEKCLAQKWIVRQKSDGAKLFTTINEAYALNINTNTNNCSMYTESSNSSADSVLEFVPYTDTTVTAADKVYKIKMANHNKYLDVESVGSGANAYWVNSPAYPLWQFVSESDMFPTPKACPTAIKDSTFAIQANGTDFYLNVHGTDTVADGRNVNIYSKDDALAQRWIPKQTTEGPKLFTKINEDFALNIHTVDNNCTMYTASGNDEDSLLEFESVGTMQYKIKMFNHNKYLAIDGTAASGSNVVWVDGSANATVWNFIPEATAFPTPNPAPTDLVGKTFFIKNYNTGYNLNVHGTNTVALGRNVNVYAKEPEDSQRWQVVQTAKGPKIVTEINETFALNIHVENSNNCVMYDINENNVDSVIEFVPYDEDNNIYKLKMFHHNKYLEAAGVGSGFNAYWSDSPVYNLWQFVEEDDMFPPVEDAPADIADKVFFIQNVNTGYYLNVHGADTVANTRNVNVYAKEDVQAQRWIIRNGTGGPKLYTRIDETFAVNIYANDNNCTMYKEEGNDVDSALEFIPYTDEQTEASENIYRIKMHYHNRYLTVANRNIGSNAYWTAVDTEPYALWKLIPESEMCFETTTPTEADSPLVTSFIPAAPGNYMVGRNGRQISEITIHHMAGNMTVQRLGAMWQDPSEVASSHYGVHGKQVGQYVKECNTAYTNGGSVIDPNAESSNFRAITIETANTGTTDSNWPVSNDTLDTLVDLVADIARRNNLGTLVPGQNLTWHSMYAYTECPGNYLRSKMQEIADRANAINSNVFIRKLGMNSFLTTDSNNNIIWSTNGNIKKWYLDKSGDKYFIYDADDTTKQLTINEETMKPILSNIKSSVFEVYGIYTENDIFKIYAESTVAMLDSENSENVITLSTLGCGINFVSSSSQAGADEMKTENEPTVSYEIQPSSISDNLDIRVVRIKDKETGWYLTASHSKHPDSESYAVTLTSLSENLDQIWEIQLIDEVKNVYGLRPFTKKDHILYIDPICGYCLTDDRSKIPSGTLSGVAGVSFDLNNNLEGKILFPTVNGYLAFATYQYGVWARYNKTNTRTWIVEKPEPVIINKWLKLDYNPQKKHANNAKPRVVDIPDYAFEIPSEYIKDSEHNISRKAVYGYSLIDPEAGDTEQNRNYYQCYEVEVRESTSNDPTDNLYAKCVYAPLQNSTQIIPYYFSERRRWGVIGEYDANDISSYVTNRNDVDTFKDSEGNDYSVLIDSNKFYWVAVGPNVVTKEHYDPNGRPGAELYNKGTIDVVLRRYGTENELYYIHCNIGDIKAHTWNNGVIQTGFKYWLPRDSFTNEYNIADRPYKSVVSNVSEYNYTVCVEFMGDTNNSNLFQVNNFYNINSKYRDYEVVEIIFYPYEPEE